MSENLDLIRQARGYGLLPESSNLWSVEDVSLIDRALASFARTPEGKSNILGNLGSRGMLRNKPGFSGEDIMDFAGEAPAAALGFAGSFGGPAFAAFGGMAGDMARQATSMALGSKERPDAVPTIVEGGASLLGDAAIRGLGHLGNRLLKPFSEGMTDRAGSIMSQGKDLDARLGTNLADTTPAAGRSENTFLRDMESRVAGSTKKTPPTNPLQSIGDVHRQTVREPHREQADLALTAIREQAGIPKSTGRLDTGDILDNAVIETLEQHRGVIDEAFDQSRKLLPDGFSAVTTSTQAALGDVKTKTGARSLSDFNISAPLRQKLSRIEEDVGNIQTFQQLDDFRKLLGSLLDAHGAREEFANVGLDAHMRNIYGALKTDLEASTRRGFQARGINPEAPNLNIPSSTRLTLARGADEALQAQKSANNLFKALMDLDSESAVRLLRDPTNLENITFALTGDRKAVGRIRKFKEKVGAADSGPLPSSLEGLQAWEAFQGDLLDIIRSKSIVDNTDVLGAVPISGDRLVKHLDQLGGERVLNELLPERLVADMYQLGRFLRESDVSERSFKRLRDEIEPQKISGMIDILTRFREGATDALLGRYLTTSRGRTFLTEGVGQSRGLQGIMSALGRAGAQFAPRAVLNPRNDTNATQRQ